MNVDRTGAVVVASGPLLMLAAILWHPFIPDLRDKADVVRHLQADTTTWFGAHLLVALASALVLLGFLAVHGHVRATIGRARWMRGAIPWLVVGTVLFVMLPAMEIGMLAVEKAGGDLLATQTALDTWFMPILVSGTIVFAVGSVAFAVGVHRARILPAGTSWVVVAGLVVSAASRVPFTLALILGVVALNVAMLILASAMWRAGGAATARPAVGAGA
jgi:hypothetical protein